MKKLYLLLIISTLALVGYSQVIKQIKTTEQLWLGYFNQIRLSDKWGLIKIVFSWG